jgi:hypothetical protein
LLHVLLTGTAPWTITWSDGVVETTSNGVHERAVRPGETTNYAITSVADANGPGTATGIATITVRVVPPPTITAAPATIGQPLTLRATTGYAAYQWFHNGAPIAGATSSTYRIASIAQSDLGTYSVRATNEGCTSAASTPYSLVLLGLPIDFDAVIPVVGNVPGAGNSLFRTTVQLTNATDEPSQGVISFIDPSLPLYPFQLAAHETRFIEDLLPASYRRLTSANIRRLLGPLPVVVAHVFNDGGARGTSGLIERAISVERTLRTGDSVVLLAPIDPVSTRMNVGLRSFGDGMSVRLTRRNAAGAIVGTIDHSVPASTLEHVPVATLAGAEIAGSESLTFEVLSGGGVIYGAATDNGTNDPNIQIAAKPGAPPRSGRSVLAAAGSTSGLFGSRFATGLQLFNPSAVPFTATLTFHPAGASGNASDPHRDLTVTAGATAAMDNVLAAIGNQINGLGSLDLVSSAATMPVMLARVYSIAEEGQLSLTTPLIAEEDFLKAGEAGVLTAPHALSVQRFNLGVRTLSNGARITATVRHRNGATLKVVTLEFGPTVFAQTSAQALLGLTFTGDESIVFSIDSGAAVIFGTWTDNITQDPALQYAVRPLTGE